MRKLPSSWHILGLSESGMTQAEIAEMYGVTQACVSIAISRVCGRQFEASAKVLDPVESLDIDDCDDILREWGAF